MPCCNAATYKRFQRHFCRQCNYTVTTLKPFTGLYSGFSIDLTRSSAHNTAITQDDYAPSAPRWRASQRRSTSSIYQTPPRRALYRTAQAAYYNKVYKGATVCPVMDPCQTVQHSADRASPAGSASPPVQSQPGGFQSGTGSAVRACRVGLAHSTRRGSPAAGVRRAARNH